MLLEKRIAIVTGGTKGIGKGIALKFASEGCDVVVTSRHLEDAREVADKIKASGRRSLAVRADVSRRADVDALVKQTLEQFGKIDILVNNAGGISQPKDTSIEDTSEEDWDRVVDINLKGQFLCCRAVVPWMKKARYGKIINVSSIGAIHPPASIIHYHAAKGGVLSLTRDLAFDLAPFNITVNAILPGPIKTEFFNEMLDAMTKEEGEAFFARLGKGVPLGRMGTPDEVAGVALFLASELSSYVTGEAICVGGGLPLSPKDG
jgi:3-oxoacyl-[acyl-carrier protein] reductase